MTSGKQLPGGPGKGQGPVLAKGGGHPLDVPLPEEALLDEELIFEFEAEGLDLSDLETILSRDENGKLFEGLSRSEVLRALEDSGWYNAGPTSGEGGIRFRLAGNVVGQVRIMPGNPS